MSVHRYEVDSRELEHHAAVQVERSSRPASAAAPSKNSPQRVRADLTAALGQYRRQAEPMTSVQAVNYQAGSAHQLARRSQNGRNPSSSFRPSSSANRNQQAQRHPPRAESAPISEIESADDSDISRPQETVGPYLILNRVKDIRTSPTRQSRPQSSTANRLTRLDHQQEQQQRRNDADWPLMPNAAASANPNGSMLPTLPSLQLQLSMMMDRQREVLNSQLAQLHERVDASVTRLDKRMGSIEKTCEELKQTISDEVAQSRKQRDALNEQLVAVSEERDKYLRRVLSASAPKSNAAPSALQPANLSSPPSGTYSPSRQHSATSAPLQPSSQRPTSYAPPSYTSVPSPTTQQHAATNPTTAPVAQANSQLPAHAPPPPSTTSTLPPAPSNGLVIGGLNTATVKPATSPPPPVYSAAAKHPPPQTNRQQDTSAVINRLASAIQGSGGQPNPTAQ